VGWGAGVRVSEQKQGGTEGQTKRFAKLLDTPIYEKTSTFGKD